MDRAAIDVGSARRDAERETLGRGQCRGRRSSGRASRFRRRRRRSASSTRSALMRGELHRPASERRPRRSAGRECRDRAGSRPLRPRRCRCRHASANGRRDRGSAAGSRVTTTGSRTITSASAEPTLVFDHATAITRTEPLKAGRSKQTLRRAVGADLDDAGEQRQRRLGRQIAFEIAAVVAAGLQRAGGALHAVDQQPVEIADVDGELALAEEIAARVRRLEPRQIEDADVDRGDRDLGLFAGREAADLDRQGQRLARPGLLRRVDRDVELVRGFVDARTRRGPARGRACAWP